MNVYIENASLLSLNYDFVNVLSISGTDDSFTSSSSIAAAYYSSYLLWIWPCVPWNRLLAGCFIFADME